MDNIKCQEHKILNTISKLSIYLRHAYTYIHNNNKKKCAHVKHKKCKISSIEYKSNTPLNTLQFTINKYNPNI